MSGRLVAMILGGAIGAAGIVTPASAVAPGTCELSHVGAHDIVTYALRTTPEEVVIFSSCDPDTTWTSVTGYFILADGTKTAEKPASPFDPGEGISHALVRTFTHRSPAGLSEVVVNAVDETGLVQTRTGSFQVRRNAKITGFNAGPEDRPVGSNLKSSGKLTRLNGSGVYVPWVNKGVVIEFRKAGTTTWVRQGTDTTDSTGQFAKTVRTKGDGTWRARAGRTETNYGPISRSDYVNVT